MSSKLRLNGGKDANLAIWYQMNGVFFSIRKNYMGNNETPFERITSMKSVAIAKKIVTSIVGFGTAKIIKDIIENNVETDTVYQKVTVGSASVAIGYAVSETTSEYTDRKIDEAVAFWQKHVTNRKNSAE